MKTCANCNVEKSNDLFHKRNGRAGGLQSKCIECAKKYRNKNKEKLADRAKLYRIKNIDKLTKQGAAWAAANKERKAATNKISYEKNKEKYKQYRIENAEKIKSQYEVWYAKNREKRALQSVAWRANNKDKIYASNRNRRALIRGMGGRHSADDVKFLMIQQRNKCAHKWCAKDLDSGYHVDHITSLSKGGSNDRLNLQLLCPFCNVSKKDKDPIDYAQAHGMLL